MDLPDDAAAALAAARRTGRNVRFEVKKACEQERWRLKVLYEVVDPQTGDESTVQLGLLWHDDRAAIHALRERLARGEDGRGGAAP
jgi:hypothetical protein